MDRQRRHHTLSLSRGLPHRAGHRTISRAGLAGMSVVLAVVSRRVRGGVPAEDHWLAERHSALSPPHVDLLSADTDLLKTKALIQTPSWVDAEDVQGEGALSARAQVDESLDDRGPKAEVLQLGAHFDTGQVEVVFTPLDVHDTNQETAHLNDLSVTSVLHPSLMERLLHVLVPGAVDVLDVRPHRGAVQDVQGCGVARLDRTQLVIDHTCQHHAFCPACHRTEADTHLPLGSTSRIPIPNARLDFLRRGQAASLTLAQLRQVLQIRDAGQPPWESVRDLLGLRRANLEAQIAELLALRETIAQLGAAASATEPDTGPPNRSAVTCSSSRHG